jgi:hypothetical protein
LLARGFSFGVDCVLGGREQARAKANAGVLRFAQNDNCYFDSGTMTTVIFFCSGTMTALIFAAITSNVR